MRRVWSTRWLSVCTAWLLAPGAIAQQDSLQARISPVVAGQMREAFETTASELTFLDAYSFLCMREPLGISGAEVDRYLEQIRHALPGAHGDDRNRQVLRRDSFEPLLEHDDPKVRTLAILALVDLDDPKLLPMIATQLNDDSPTFPKPIILSHVMRDAPLKLEPQTVRDVVVTILRCHDVEFTPRPTGGMQPRPGTIETQFDSYWSERAHRSSCVGWWKARVLRASSGRWPMKSTQQMRVNMVGERIKRELAGLERDFTLLATLSNEYERAFYDRQELLYAGRRIGADRLLAFIEGADVIDDPDLPMFRERVERFVLENAVELLDAGQVPALLARGRTVEQAHPFLAAAALDPAHAVEHLREGLQIVRQRRWLGRDQSMLAVALLEAGGIAEADVLTEWFFEQELSRGSMPPRYEFVQQVTRRWRRDDRMFLASIVLDDRFADLDWSTLRALIQGLNNNLSDPILSNDEIKRLRHPMGESLFHHHAQSGSPLYLAETELALLTLDEWRAHIRTSLPLWNPSAD